MVSQRGGPSYSSHTGLESGYHLENGYQGSITGDCQSAVASGAVLTYAATIYGSPSVWQTETTTLTTASFVGAIAVVGWNIVVEETPKTTTTAVATGPGTSTSTTPTLPQLPNNTNLQPQQSERNPPSSLSSPSSAESSNGTPIGASVGASLGVVTLIMGAAWLVVRRRRKRSRGEIGEFDALTPAPAPAEQPGWGGLNCQQFLWDGVGRTRSIASGPVSSQEHSISGLWWSWTGDGSDDIVRSCMQ
ncbi:uncharacterized protein PG998_002285 [Apiospora kogelbergensis]|uniref:uncharacterized protein n=1 Tax=Apiospora kogelbergensis TaxID=1337665 RepID=UPI00312DFB42